MNNKENTKMNINNKVNTKDKKRINNNNKNMRIKT